MKALLTDTYLMPNAMISEIAYGMMNHNYLVQTQDDTYVLKAYSAHLYPPDRVRRVCSVQKMLRQSGLPVPDVIATAAGELVAESKPGCCYVLSRFVLGQHPQRLHIRAAAAFSMGHTLGRLHHVLERMDRVTDYAVMDWETAMDRTEQLLRLAEPHRHATGVDEIAYQVLQSQLAAIERLAVLRAGLPKLPAQWVHGDYQETNLLFDKDDQITAVIDFDNLRCVPRGLELMRTMHLCFYNRRELLPEAYDFFAGYAATANGLTTDEVEALVPYWTYQEQITDWPMRTRYEQPDKYDPRWDRFIQISNDFWETHRGPVTERFLKILRTSNNK
ncbi:Ser/Thr protein kinase RdoA (MazF antagonist) [Tumebacillus sp. BK434]|uniref:phosphotransferase n=1 Tax=Tumebacillus sp. BK434 TaxID=2512169 RepID=UPI001051AE1E|nr:phosphotransferase [Tumebacillus sp. BK434]TCP55773.1 Ser/Thr protein kinase RdoA (MazF antagonist) [Tumebacillus sp. BK434]